LKTLKVALLGFGNAGRAFARLLMKKEAALEARFDCHIAITAISTHTHGCAVDAGGLDLAEAVQTVEAGGRLRGDASLSAMDIITMADYDVLFEMTPLNIRTGQPAIDHIKAAFARGKHVVTANKGPIAWAFDELSALAASRGALFFYETTVMDGTPVFNLAQLTLPETSVTEVSGILNTTTNYILEELAAGKAYEDILSAGRALGFIEADAAMDIEGYDAAAKLTALLNVLMHAHMTPDQVERTGIEHITPADIRAAAARESVIKLYCRGWRDSGRLRATVQPVEVPRGSLLATIDATSSVVSITTEEMGKLSVVEHNPLIEQTAYGLFSDLIRVLNALA
jgi:homoserine dehydrogenase